MRSMFSAPKGHSSPCVRISTVRTVSRSIPIRRTGPRMAFLQSSGGLFFGCIQWSSTVLPVNGSGMPSRARMMAMRM